MDILVNAIPLTEITTGIQRYVRCLYTELQSLDGISVSYFRRSACDSKMPLQANPDVWSRKTDLISELPDAVVVGLKVIDRLGFEHRLKQAARKKKYSVYHEPNYFPPVIDGLPVVYTIHDLSLIKHRDKHPRERVWFNDLFFKRRLPHAAHIITVSNFVKNEVVEELGVAPDKVTAVHLSHGPLHHPRPRAEIIEWLNSRGWPTEYILFVGTLEPRKNLSLLIQALAMMKSDVPLLLTGWSGWGDKAWWGEIRRLGLQDRVVVTGYIDDEDLARLYCGASAFVYPSFYEGFGLPVLEAMACGCPVLCSNCASLPEVAGNGAVLLDPRDPEALAKSLEKILHDSSMREYYIAAGLQRSLAFSWKKTASETLGVFAKVSEPQ
jgi:glycosyltransferase involved in cell wall biosynthesis